MSHANYTTPQWVSFVLLCTPQPMFDKIMVVHKSGKGKERSLLYLLSPFSPRLVSQGEEEVKKNSFTL